MVQYTYYSMDEFDDLSGDLWQLVGTNISDDRQLVPYGTTKTIVTAYGTFLTGVSCGLHVTILVALSRLVTGGSSGLDTTLLTFFSGCQLCSVVFGVPFEIIREYFGKWYFGATLCKVWISYSHLFVPIMLWLLTALALDRIYDLRCMRVYKYTKKTCKTSFMLLGVFLLSAVGLVPLQAWMHLEPRFVLLEVCAVIVDREYTLILAALFYFIPTCVLVGCLIVLAVQARKRIAQLGRAERQESLIALDPKTNCPVHEEKCRTSHDVDTFIADMKNSCVCITVTSFICVAMWAPFYVSNVWLSHGNCDNSFCLDPKLWELFQWIGYTNNLICPCVLFIDKRLRATIRYWMRLDINHGDFVYRKNNNRARRKGSDVSTSIV